MKRYEKMSKEEIIDLFRGIDDCWTCPIREKCIVCRDTCYKVYTDYFYEELTPTVIEAEH